MITVQEHPTNEKLWAFYLDVLGQRVEADCFVAYASISGKSPQLVIAKCLQVNRINSYGEPITTRRRYNEPDEPYCTVKVRPVLDARGFWRGGAMDGASPGVSETKVKAVTLSIPENVIRIDWNPNKKAQDLLARFVETI